MDFQIKKSQIAINAADARPSRFTGGERIDCAIADLDLEKRKVNLSIKLLEEIEKKVRLLEKNMDPRIRKKIYHSNHFQRNLRKRIKKNKIYTKINWLL